MPDTAVLNIINLNFDSIQAEVMSCKSKRWQETHTAVEGHTNSDTEGIFKQEANGQNDQNHSNKLINYFYSSSNMEADKRKSSIMTQKSMIPLVMFLMVLGDSKVHSHYNLSQTASNTKCHQGMWHMCYRNHSRRN